jgi:deazaflavin-dependent oxidoreductase (nitroreductase family)
MARVNKRVSNKVLRPIVLRLPGFGEVTHRGRRSGREFRTPVSVFLKPGRVVFALTYGKDSDWVKNVLAAGSCDLRVRGGRSLHLVGPRLVHDETRAEINAPVRLILRAIRVEDFLVCDTA